MRALSAANSLVQVTGSNLNLVYLVLGVSLVALAIAWALRSQVLAASAGTPKMQEIAAAVQEGAAAYLARQFKTLSYFVVIVFLLLFALPGDMDVKIGRSIFFLIGAAFSATVGYQGMWLAVRANVRVAEAARQGSAVNAVQIAFRTGGVVGMLTVGLGLFGASLVVVLYQADAP
ncbi:MAG: sodium/proton-translocating pyrophosphatase, partial [Candidatus Nanopelagicaceae bacterium]